MSSPKAKKGDGGAPAWIVTFADLMSLLLTFFVLLLSFSNMEVQEFKKVAGAMRSAFGLQSFDRLAGIIELDGTINGTAATQVLPIPIPESDGALQSTPLAPEPKKPEISPVQDVPDKQAEASRKTFNDIQNVMAREIASDVMTVMRAGNTTIVRFPDRQSFSSGSGDLKSDFFPVIGKILPELEKSNGQIIISGHTDDIPINTEKYRSNWDLSASRATSMAHYILKHSNIAASRITVQGYADSRPLAPNDNNQNRAKNRRVEITIDQSQIAVPAAQSQAVNPAGQ